MSKQAFIFNEAGETEYRIIVKTDSKRTDDKRFDGATQQEAGESALAFLESSGISERFVCDTREYHPDTI